MSTSPALASGGIRGSIHGSVIDRTTKAPLVDVSVTATSPAGAYRTTTDTHGFFSLIGVPADTYTVTLSKTGYAPTVLAGITVIGDQSVDLGKIAFGEKILGHVMARAVNSAFQPKQTQDTTTISGTRITQALGNAQSTNEQNLILSAPGAVNDSSGNVSIRGSLTVELGYQFDGVPFDAPFFGENGSNGFLNNIGGGSGGALQVVSGAGDATQGNQGAGIINIIPGRGTYPSKAELDFEVRSPYYDHRLNFNYGFATPDNRFSNYLAISTNRDVPTYAPFGVDSSTVGQFNGFSYEKHDDLLDNFFFRFGKKGDQQLQVLARFADFQQLGNYGGLGLSRWYPTDARFTTTYSGLLPLTGPSSLQNLVTYFPGVPVGNGAITQPELANYQPLHFLKVGYTKNINPTTFFDLSFYNWGLIAGTTDYSQGDASDPHYAEVGGSRVGSIAEITHLFGENHQTTLALKFENGFPRWDQQGAGTMFNTLGFGSPGAYAPADNTRLYGSVPTIYDWYSPANFPGQPVSATNPCIVPDINGVLQSITDPNNQDGCYIYNYMIKNGLWKGAMPKVPTMGIGYHNSDFQQAGIGIRDQWTVSSRLKLDYGVRLDVANYRFGPNQFAKDPFGNPSDVNPHNYIGNDFLRPHFTEPRFAAAYQLGDHDSIRGSYGRSVQFFFAQTAGTPAAANLKYWDAIFAKIPPKDTPGNPQCGSGWHGPGSGYTQNGNNAYSGFNPPGWFFPCSSYEQQLFWTWDQLNDAPDLGGQGPPTYNDYDLEWTHEFTHGRLAGWGMKLGGFSRRGYHVEQNIFLANGPPDPVTGQVSAAVFATRATGVEKVAGVEALITTPDTRSGVSGFLTLNYVNQLSNTPPVSGGGVNFQRASDSLPILPQQLLATGLLFHGGFLPPFSGRLGATYQSTHGLKITPTIDFNGGYPFGVGKTSIGFVNGVLYTIPETNFGVGAPFAGPNGPGNAYNGSYYVDPAYPGNYFNPNIAASRGYNEPALAGQALTRPQAFANVNVEYPVAKNMTLGVTVDNIFNNHYSIPYVNPNFQPVATGVGGPQSGQFPGAYPGTDLYNGGARDSFALAGSKMPFQTGFNAGTIFNMYIQSKF